jgi:hypothetical protein
VEIRSITTEGLILLLAPPRLEVLMVLCKMIDIN